MSSDRARTRVPLPAGGVLVQGVDRAVGFLDAGGVDLDRLTRAIDQAARRLPADAVLTVHADDERTADLVARHCVERGLELVATIRTPEVGLAFTIRKPGPPPSPF